MNSFYKVFNLILFIHNLFIIVGILLAVIALRVDFMLHYLALNGDTVFFQWIIIFILFLIEFLFYLKKIINRKKLIFSIIVIIIHYYLTYLEKQLQGFRINASLSIYRIIFLWLSLLPFLLFDKTNEINLKEFIIGFILVSLIYFIISVIIELWIDFILQRDLAKSV